MLVPVFKYFNSKVAQDVKLTKNDIVPLYSTDTEKNNGETGGVAAGRLSAVEPWGVRR